LAGIQEACGRDSEKIRNWRESQKLFVDFMDEDLYNINVLSLLSGQRKP
jgi:hypothetical protein